jgi:hypothetical protein
VKIKSSSLVVSITSHVLMGPAQRNPSIITESSGARAQLYDSGLDFPNPTISLTGENLCVSPSPVIPIACAVSRARAGSHLLHSQNTMNHAP